MAREKERQLGRAVVPGHLQCSHAVFGTIAALYSVTQGTSSRARPGERYSCVGVVIIPPCTDRTVWLTRMNGRCQGSLRREVCYGHGVTVVAIVLSIFSAATDCS